MCVSFLQKEISTYKVQVEQLKEDNAVLETKLNELETENRQFCEHIEQSSKVCTVLNCLLCLESVHC